jgi:putative addiction module CopG family antidote
MRSTQQMSITLPLEMAKRVKQRVSNGDYASESEVTREGLRALQERENAVEHWLRTELRPPMMPTRPISAFPMRRNWIGRVSIVRKTSASSAVARDYVARIKTFVSGFETYHERRSIRDHVRPGLRIVVSSAG